MFFIQAWVSCLEAWGQFIDVATHPYAANHVGAPRDAQSQKKQGVVGPTVIPFAPESAGRRRKRGAKATPKSEI